MRIQIANTPALINAVHRIRHQVYCEELDFIDLESNRLEKDIYDSHSVHLLLFEAEKPIGCARIVSGILPCQEFEEYLFDADMDWSNTCEISRLALLSEYRKPKYSQFLYYHAYKYGKDHKLNQVAIMQESLARRLTTVGYDIARISDFFELDGQRAIFKLAEYNLDI